MVNDNLNTHLIDMAINIDAFMTTRRPAPLVRPVIYVFEAIN
jgi:hypothetical protein